MKTKEQMTFFGLSDMGKQRTNNEDAFVAEKLDDKTVLAVAIDGVGGYEGGEVAAEIAQTEIPRYLHDFRNGERLELLKQAVVFANNAIYDRRLVDTARSSMSCVLTAAVIDTQRKVIDMVHVGDTRLYQYHHGELIKLSHDHSLIGYREEVGDLTEEQAMHHPQRNVISRDVGSAKHEVEDRDFLEAAEFSLLPNSILLLCSDGLTDLITSKQIVSILCQNKTLEKKAQDLIDVANDAGGKDNITVVLVEYKSNEKDKETIQTTTTATVQAQEEIKPTKTVVDEKVNEEQQVISTNDMKKTNLWVVIAIVIIAILSCLSLWLNFRTNQQMKRLQSDFDNHLQYSEIQDEIPTVTKETLVADSLSDSLMLQKDAEIKRLNEQLKEQNKELENLKREVVVLKNAVK